MLPSIRAAHLDAIESLRYEQKHGVKLVHSNYRRLSSRPRGFLAPSGGTLCLRLEEAFVCQPTSPQYRCYRWCGFENRKVPPLGLKPSVRMTMMAGRFGNPMNQESKAQSAALLAD